MIRAVLFDMDGILCDSEAFYMEGTLAWMRRYGYQGTLQEICTIVGTTMEETYRILRDLLGGVLTEEEIAAENDRYFREECPLNYAEIMFADVPQMLAKLKDAGYLLACCSSSPRHTVDKALQEMGIRLYFDCVLAAEDIRRNKPFPDVYLKAAEKLGVQPQECVVYEDSRPGTEAGKRAGMFVIARRDERFGQDVSEADMITDNIREMTEAVIRGTI